jgi:hypothetical protein
LTNKFVKLQHIGVNEAFKPETEKKPLSAVLSNSQFKILAVIASFQTVGGFCDSSLGQLSKATGISEKTISEQVWKLHDLRYDGKQILKVTEGVYKNKPKLFFQLLPNPLFSVYSIGEEISVIDSKITEKTSDTIYKNNIEKELKNNDHEEESNMTREMSPKEVITEFVECMKKKHKEYKVVWGRDMKWAKKYLSSVEDLKNNEKKKLIEITVENYERWSTNGRFPFNVNTLSIEWIQKKAREELKREKENMSQIEQRSVEAGEVTFSAVSRILSRKKKEGSN